MVFQVLLSWKICANLCLALKNHKFHESHKYFVAEIFSTHKPPQIPTNNHLVESR